MAGWCGGRVYLILRQYTSPVFTRLSRPCLSMILSLTVLISWFFWPLVSFSCRVVYYIQPPSHYPRRFHRRPAVTKTVTPRFQNFPFGILGSTVQYTVLYLKTLNRKASSFHYIPQSRDYHLLEIMAINPTSLWFFSRRFCIEISTVAEFFWK